MKSGLSSILGRRIIGAFLGYLDGSPRSRLYIAFDDDTAYEFYSGADEIRNTSGVDHWSLADVAAYMHRPDNKFLYSAVFDPGQPRAIEWQQGYRHGSYYDETFYAMVPPARYRR